MADKMNSVIETRYCALCGAMICYSVGWGYQYREGSIHRYFCKWEHMQRYRSKDKVEHKKALRKIEAMRQAAIEVAKGKDNELKDAVKQAEASIKAVK